VWGESCCWRLTRKCCNAAMDRGREIEGDGHTSDLRHYQRGTQRCPGDGGHVGESGWFRHLPHLSEERRQNALNGNLLAPSARLSIASLLRHRDSVMNALFLSFLFFAYTRGNRHQQILVLHSCLTRRTGTNDRTHFIPAQSQFPLPTSTNIGPSPATLWHLLTDHAISRMGTFFFFLRTNAG